jgi:hypothetical protein
VIPRSRICWLQYVSTHYDAKGDQAFRIWKR